MIRRKVAFSDPESPRHSIKLVLQEISWPDLCEFLCTCQQGEKNDAYFLRGGTMVHIGKYVSGSGKNWGAGYFRDDRNLINAWLVVIDGDQTKDGTRLPPANVMSNIMDLSGLKYCIYTTHSQKKNKWRIIIPTDKSYSKEQLPGLVNFICDWIDQKFDGFQIDRVREMYVWSQAWYLPHDIGDGQFKSYCGGTKLLKV